MSDRLIWFSMPFVAILMALAIWLQIGIWNECREHGHSWFYCLRIISAK